MIKSNFRIQCFMEIHQHERNICHTEEGTKTLHWRSFHFLDQRAYHNNRCNALKITIKEKFIQESSRHY